MTLSHSTQAADGTPPLTGVRVVEVCDSIAGAHCGKLLAHMGAEVTKVEPPEGDPARGHGAFPGGAPHDETSALFLHLNANKRSATLAVGSATGRAILDRLAAASDVLVYDTPELSDPAAGVDGLVRVAITPFGLDGPNAGYRASDLTSFASGGEAYTLPGNLSYELFPERGPVRAGGYLAEHDAGVLGALAALSALLSRSRNGSGERVDLSKQEASMAMARETLQRFAGYDEQIDWRRTYFFGGIFPRHRRPRGPLPPRGPALGGAVRCDGPARPRRRSQVRHLRRAPRPPSRAQRRDACVGRRPGEADDLSRRRVERLSRRRSSATPATWPPRRSFAPAASSSAPPTPRRAHWSIRRRPTGSRGRRRRSREGRRSLANITRRSTATSSATPRRDLTGLRRAGVV